MTIALTKPGDAPADWDELSLWEQLAVLPEEEQNDVLWDLMEGDVDLTSPEVRLRPAQLCVLSSDAWIIFFAAGRGAGKTMTGAEWVIDKAKRFPGCRIALLGRTVSDVRDTIINGESGIMACSSDGFMPVYTPSLRKLTWPNESIALTYSSDQPSQLRGPQQHFGYADELAAFRSDPDSSGATAWDNLVLSTRLGEHPQILVTTTPKRVEVIRDLFRRAERADSGVELHKGSIWANRANLSTEYMESIFERYGGTHLERQELYGELIGDSPGALWRSEDIVIDKLPTLEEEPEGLIYVIGVDPAVKAGGDDTGIVVVACNKDRNIFKRKAWVVEDLTLNGPVDQWARVVIEAQAKYSQPYNEAIVVVEGNQGGDVLKLVLHQEVPSMPVAVVHAIRSKAARADPVVMAYRQKRVFHTSHMSGLVDEMTGWEPDISRWSPGHLDANVWALSTLLVDPKPLYPFAPILIANPTETRPLLENAVPAYRRHRANIGLAAAPWRHHR